MINRFVGVGRLVADPELKYTPSGVPMCKFRIAVNRNFKQEGQPEADFIGCLAWRKQAENLANYMKKGSLIGLEGRIQTGNYEGQDGKRFYTTDVVADSIQFLEPRSNNSDSSNSASNYQTGTNYQSQQQTQNTGQYGGHTQQNNGQSAQYGQQNYTRMDEDPFASNKGPIEVTEDDLPF